VYAVRSRLEVGYRRLLFSRMLLLLWSVSRTKRHGTAGLIVVPSVLLLIPVLTPLLWCRLQLSGL
jgi:hypothetical protein